MDIIIMKFVIVRIHAKGYQFIEAIINMQFMNARITRRGIVSSSSSSC